MSKPPDAIEIWRKVELSVEANRRAKAAQKQDSKTGSKSEAEEKAEERRFRRIRRTLDALGLLLWSYFLVKLLVLDIDREILERVAPGALGVLDYRFFGWLLLLAIIVATRKRQAYVGALYVLGFPLVVLFWKLPVFFVKRRSWSLLLASFNALFVALSDFRYNFLTKTAAVFAALAILLRAPDPLLVVAAVYLAVLLVMSIERTIRRSFRPSPFLTVQREKISLALDSDRFRAALAIPDDLRSDEIELYTTEEVSQFALRLSLGIGICRGLYLWAYQLERYRRSSAMPILLNGLAYVWLFLGTTLGLALINYAVLEIAPDQYAYEEPPSFLAVTLYSLSSLALNEGGGFSATGDLAFALRILGGIAGVVFLASFVLNLVLTSRRERDETAMKETIADLKERGREQEKRFLAEYAVGVDEARRRLENVASIFASWLEHLTRAIPEEFMRDGEPRGRPPARRS